MQLQVIVYTYTDTYMLLIYPFDPFLGSSERHLGLRSWVDLRMAEDEGWNLPPLFEEFPEPGCRW